jgi:hypothetical protein
MGFHITIIPYKLSIDQVTRYKHKVCDFLSLTSKREKNCRIDHWKRQCFNHLQTSLIKIVIIAFRTKVWEIDPNHDNESIHTDNQIFPFAWMVNTHLHF